MIEEAYVSFETAKLLKKKGFDETCYACYEYFSSSVTMYSGWPFEYKGEVVHNSKDRIKCPTQQMTMRWLRKVHGIHVQAFCPVIDVDCDITGVKYNAVISNLRNCCISFDTPIEDVEYDTYEEAVEAAIKYCLENLIKTE